MNFNLTQPASQVMEERQIPVQWMGPTVTSPELRLPDPDGEEIERRFLRIPESGGRVLRAVVNNKAVPELVVSVFFDRSMRGKL